MAELQGLPSVLAPLQSLLDEQKMLVYSLQPLPEIVQVQRATVALLQAMQAEQQTPPAPTGTSASAIA